MKSTTLIWTILFIVGAMGLAARAALTGMGSSYVRPVAVTSPDGQVTTRDELVPPRERDAAGVRLSVSRTLGTWVAALLTLCVFTFLYGDNVFYKFAESILIGVSAAYVMVVGFWTIIIPNLASQLAPDLVRRTVMPGLPEDKQAEWLYLVPLILSVMMLWRLLPRGGWISRWPLAFFIGATAGIRLIAYLEADFVNQINNTIMPLIVMSAGRFDFWASAKNITIVGGVLCCLVYFFFSVEHTGAVGKVARVGIWLLMITFGAGFGYTVMGRITLLAGRLEFLFDKWLWLIDPGGTRAGM